MIKLLKSHQNVILSGYIVSNKKLLVGNFLDSFLESFLESIYSPYLSNIVQLWCVDLPKMAGNEKYPILILNSVPWKWLNCAKYELWCYVSIKSNSSRGLVNGTLNGTNVIMRRQRGTSHPLINLPICTFLRFTKSESTNMKLFHGLVISIGNVIITILIDPYLTLYVIE